MATSTARDMIQDAAREAGILGETETLGAAQAASGLRRLNRMLASWRLSKLYVFALEQIELTLQVNKGVYTIGASGDFDRARPTQIVAPCFVRENDTDYPINVIDKVSYAGIISKSSVTSNYPCELHYEADYPLGIISLYPVPSAANKLFINVPKELQEFATLTEQIVLPPGYEEAIVYNLAVRHAVKKGFAVNPDLRELARMGTAMIKTNNVRKRRSRTDIPVGTRGRNYQITADR